MNSILLLACRVCLALSTAGVVIGLLLAASSFFVTPETVLTVRSSALAGLGVYLFGVAAAYVLIAQRVPAEASLSGKKVNVFAGVPSVARPFAYGVVLTAVAAFFVSIALVESQSVGRTVGEVAIFGWGLVGFFAAIACGLWSAVRCGTRNDA